MLIGAFPSGSSDSARAESSADNPKVKSEFRRLLPRRAEREGIDLPNVHRLAERRGTRYRLPNLPSYYSISYNQRDGAAKSSPPRAHGDERRGQARSGGNPCLIKSKLW